MIVAADAGAESVERNHGKVYIEFPKLGGFTRCMGIKENLAVVFHDDEGNRERLGRYSIKKGSTESKFPGKTTNTAQETYG